MSITGSEQRCDLCVHGWMSDCLRALSPGDLTLPDVCGGQTFVLPGEEELSVAKLVFLFVC